MRDAMSQGPAFRTATPGPTTAGQPMTSRAQAGQQRRASMAGDPHVAQECPYPGCQNGYIQSGYPGAGGYPHDGDNDADDECPMCKGSGTVNVIT